jgi:hypothetical protein
MVRRRRHQRLGQNSYAILNAAPILLIASSAPSARTPKNI